MMLMLMMFTFVAHDSINLHAQCTEGGRWVGGGGGGIERK